MQTGLRVKVQTSSLVTQRLAGNAKWFSIALLSHCVFREASRAPLISGSGGVDHRRGLGFAVSRVGVQTPARAALTVWPQQVLDAS